MFLAAGQDPTGGSDVGEARETRGGSHCLWPGDYSCFGAYSLQQGQAQRSPGAPSAVTGLDCGWPRPPRGLHCPMRQGGPHLLSESLVLTKVGHPHPHPPPERPPPPAPQEVVLRFLLPPLQPHTGP